MKQKMGYKKIVYRDGRQTKIIKGNCFSDGDFVRVETESGDIYINKDEIFVIKPGTTQ